MINPFGYHKKKIDSYRLVGMLVVTTRERHAYNYQVLPNQDQKEPRLD